MSLPLIYNFSLQELADQCRESDIPAFRAKQIWHWLYNQHVDSWEAMHNIPADTRNWLSQTYSINYKTEDRSQESEEQNPVDSSQKSVSSIQNSENQDNIPQSPAPTAQSPATTLLSNSPLKLLVPLPEGEAVEAVIIPSRRIRHTETSTQPPEPSTQHPVPCPQNPEPSTQNPAPRITICISCQVGCRFKCAFCASGQAGLIRNLTAGEMILQVTSAANLLGSRPTNVVFMGIGEPFDNYEEAIKAARILNDPNGMKIGARKITISTSGIIPGIERLAKEGIQFELSVSLHASNNSVRSDLMPINNKYPLPDLIQACKQYTRTTNRIITFEYTLIRDINDKPEHAHQLTKLLRNFPCRVNLIPLSPIAEFSGKPSTESTSQMFLDTLNNAHINATMRHSQGASLKAACGQLRFAKRNTNDQ